MPPGENSQLLPGRLPPGSASAAIDAALPPEPKPADCVTQAPPQPGTAARNQRHRDRPGDMLPVAPRQTVPFQQGRVVGRQAALARPHHRDPFPGSPSFVSGSACEAPCALGWHAAPRVARRRASQGSPPGRPRPLVTIGTNAGTSRTRPPRGRGVMRCAGGEPLTASGEMVGVPALMCCAGAPRGDSPRLRWHPGAGRDSG